MSWEWIAMNLWKPMFSLGIACTFLAGVNFAAIASTGGAAGIVADIQKAPVIADGDVSGKPTDIVITLSGSLEPVAAGRGLSAGGEIRVIFPPEFELTDLDPAFPLADVPTPFPPVPPLPPMPCVPANLQCTTAVLLQGWPQQPLFPPVLFHTLSIDAADNALVFTAAQDIVPNPPAFPGIKQIHLITNGLTNPAPGNYRISVDAQTGPGGAWETGSGLVKIIPQARPSINVTSVFVKALAGLLPGGPACGPGTLPPNPANPVYQNTAVGAAAPYTWTFLLWGSDSEPLDDVILEWTSAKRARILRDNATIGHVDIDAPRGASGYGLQVNPLGCPTWMPGAPVIGGTPGIGPQPVGRLDIRFTAGDMPGTYTTTLSLNNGNTVQMFVEAVWP
jgi:hypothetical protein